MEVIVVTCSSSSSSKLWLSRKASRPANRLWQLSSRETGSRTIEHLIPIGPSPPFRPAIASPATPGLVPAYNLTVRRT